MVESVAERGLDGTTVAGLVGLAGVSKASFYEQFDDKEACFLVAYDTALREVARCALVGEGKETEDRERLRGGIAAIAELIVREPKAARLVLIDGLTAGPRIREHVRRRLGLLETLLGDRLASEGEVPRLPVAVLKGIIRGIASCARGNVLAGRTDSLPALVDPLVDWILAFDPDDSRRAFSGADSSYAVPPASGASPLDRGEAQGDRACIVAATARIAAAEGFAALTPSRISRAAGVPRRSFDDAFGDVGACFLASVEEVLGPLLVEARRAAQEEEAWQDGVLAALRRLTCDFARTPHLARLAFVEIPSATSVTLGWNQDRIALAGEALFADAPAGLRPAPVVAHATVAMIWGLLMDQVAAGRTTRLPGIADQLAYVAVVPVLGSRTAAGTSGRGRADAAVAA